MIQTRPLKPRPLPTSLAALVRLMPPMAIADDLHHESSVEMIDRLMQIEKLSPDQSCYLETLVELVEAYEARRHAIDVSKLAGIRMLRHVMENAHMSASDLARLLKVHASMGSKLLKGERQLTWSHARILAAHFKVAPELFMDST